MFRPGDNPTYHRCLKIKPHQQEASWLGHWRPSRGRKRPLRRCLPLGTTAFLSAAPLAAPTESGRSYLTPKRSQSSPEQPARPTGGRGQPHSHMGSIGPQWALLACPSHQAGSALNHNRMVPMDQQRQAIKKEGPLFPAPPPRLPHAPASHTPLLSTLQRAEDCL